MKDTIITINTTTNQPKATNPQIEAFRPCEKPHPTKRKLFASAKSNFHAKMFPVNG